MSEFFTDFRGTEIFIIQKTEIWKINYSENKVKLNNKDKCKNNVNEINQIIKPKNIIFISLKFFAPGIYLLKLNNKNSRARCAICLTNKDTGKTSFC